MRLAALPLIPILALCAVTPSSATAADGDELVAALRVAPPFVIEDGPDEYSGIVVDLWNRVAADAGVSARFEVMDVEDSLAAVRDGRADLALAALTVTAEREAAIDFCHPFTSSGLGIAVRAGDHAGWGALLGAVVSPALAKAVAALALVLLVAGALVWVFERRANPEQFGGSTAHGLGSSFWWAAVTMTTVGYGDKAPATVGGRIVALVWMFASLIIISGFTAAIASALTVGSLGRAIGGADDLTRVPVGAIAGTTSEDWATERGLAVTSYDTVDAALAALAADDVRAVVHDAPLLRWSAAQMPGRPVEVLPGTIERQDYAWAVAEGSPLRERLNRAILDVIDDPSWRDVVERYLGGG